MSLFCIVHGDPDAAPFAVKIEKTDTVSDFKEFIKIKKRPEFDSIDPDRLKLWKWNKPTDDLKLDGVPLDPIQLMMFSRADAPTSS